MRPLLFLLPALFIIMFVTACSSGSSGERTSPGAVDNPLPIDPTDRIKLGEWWFNGERLLHLRPDNVYVLYPGSNRYEAHDERGRWTHETYAALFLEPYELRHVGRERVQIERQDDEIVLRFSRPPVFRSLSHPPTVLEDRLIGVWTSGNERYEINANGRYRMRRVETSGAPAQLTGQDGVWRVVDRQLVLQPDSNRLAVMHIDIVFAEPVSDDSEAGFTLRKSDGPIWKKE